MHKLANLPALSITKTNDELIYNNYALHELNAKIKPQNKSLIKTNFNNPCILSQKIGFLAKFFKSI